jgi:hypothetical protein
MPAREEEFRNSGVNSQSFWRASGPSAPWEVIVALFGWDEASVECWSPYRVPRLLGAAARTAALQVPIKTLIALIDLEGCSPLQPREQNIV